MENLFIDYLFNKNFFVAQEIKHDNQIDILLALAKLFNIEITDGFALLEPEMIRTAERNLGIHVPEPFYRGFPQSVKELTSGQFIFDQIAHYMRTYGTGDFSEAGHSIFETELCRQVLNEEAEIKKFEVLTESEARNKLDEYVTQLLCSSRALSGTQYELVREFIKTYGIFPNNCASKNTAICLIIDLREPQLYRYISLYDIPKLAEQINWEGHNVYKRYNPKKLKLKNQDRKLITKILDKIFIELYKRNDADYAIKQMLPCFEQKARWSGLLHHIHYKPKCELAADFLRFMRGDKNYSTMSNFEKLMSMAHAEGTGITIATAARYLLKEKGQGALLRNLDYMVSRCHDSSEIEEIVSLIDSKNIIMLYQLMLHYNHEQPEKRIFTFVRHNMMVTHTELPNENSNRKTLLNKITRNFILNALENQIEKILKGRLGKVYISPEMRNIALPLQEAASNGGYGTMTHGSRIHIPEGKKIRAFTYWEKVDDIDLSVIGLDRNQKQTEFSWRTMWNRQTDAICYSGDQTAGYNGGSEYFDLDVKKFKEKYPEMRYLIFCNNMYSSQAGGFKSCICRAGFMTRDIQDSGEVFEPKTVKSSFTINCESRFAYLFAIDLETNDFIWLNLDHSSEAHVAGATSMAFLTQYFDILEAANVYDFFAMMATELTMIPSNADVIVSDDILVERGAWPETAEVIRSYDTERIMQLMNS